MLLGNISCKLHLLRRGQLHHCDQKIAFLFLDLKGGKELIFTPNRFSLKVKKKKKLHTSFSGLGETKQKH